MEEKIKNYCKKQIENIKTSPKSIIKKWWFWILIISIVYGISTDSTNISEINSISISNVIENSTNTVQVKENQVIEEEANKSYYIYSDEFNEYIDKKVKSLIATSDIFSTYDISSIGNSTYKIYCYTDKYYDLASFSNSTKIFIQNLVISISEKEYKSKYFAPKEAIISIEFCGYGKNLNTKEIEDSLHPLATFFIKTNELKSTDDVLSKLEVYDYWF